MPRWKYVSNRFLTELENLAFGLRLSEYHTGLRAYSRHLLETVPYQLNSDDFVFDQELIAQVVAAGMTARIGEIAVPTRYFEEASSVGSGAASCTGCPRCGWWLATCSIGCASGARRSSPRANARTDPGRGQP